MRRLPSVASLPLWATLLSCTGQTDAVSQHINACLLVTETEVAMAIGAPVSAPEKRSDTQCLYRAKGNTDEMVVVELDQEPAEDKREQFNKDRKKHARTLIAGLGDAAFTSPAPPQGIHLTFMKNDALVTVTMSSVQHGRAVEAVTNLGKAAAGRLAAHLSAKVEPAAGLSLSPLLSSASWTGDWYGCQPVGLLNGKGRLTLNSSGGWSMTAAVVNPGILIATKGQWHLESFQDILHGTYQLNGKESFATTGILSVTWNRIPKNQGPSRFDRTLYKALTGVPHKLGVKRLPPVEPALLGAWESSAKFLERDEQFVWSIASNNTADFYRAISWSGEMERDSDGFRLVTMPAKAVSFHVKVLTPDTLEVTGSDGVPSQWGRKESILARC